MSKIAFVKETLLRQATRAGDGELAVGRNVIVTSHHEPSGQGSGAVGFNNESAKNPAVERVMHDPPFLINTAVAGGSLTKPNYRPDLLLAMRTLALLNSAPPQTGPRRGVGVGAQRQRLVAQAFLGF